VPLVHLAERHPSVSSNKAAKPHEKNPMSLVTPGFALFCSDGSQVSEAQGAGQTIRHENGESLKTAYGVYKH
jgi:hypothetical protein